MESISETEYFQDLDFLQSLINTVREGVVLQDHLGKIVGFNQRACEILNLSADQLLGKSSYDEAEWRAIHLNGEPAPGHTHPISITLRTGQPINDFIMGVVAGNKKVKWLSVCSRLVTAGEERLAFATFTDVTELINSHYNLAEQRKKLQSSEKKFEKFFRYSAIGKAIVSPRGEIMDTNEAFCKMLGYTKQELVQLSFPHITHPDDTSKDLPLFESLLKKEIDSYQMEKRYLHKNGSIIWALLHVAPVWESAEGSFPDFVIAQVQEITETKKLNHWLEERNAELLKTQTQLKRKISQLKDFAGIITHDVRGPAGNIKRMLEIYESTDNEETRRTAFFHLKKISKDLSNNLNELIQVLQIHLDEDLPAVECSFSAVIDNVCMQLNALIEQKQARIDLACNVATIHYPKVYLQSILYNLISNSLKYTREGVIPEIRIMTWTREGHTYLSVTDNGLGIDMGRYGSSLFRFQKSFHSGYDSKGIGLYLIRNQIEDLGGSITAESEVNKGSVFTIRF